MKLEQLENSISFEVIDLYKKRERLLESTKMNTLKIKIIYCERVYSHSRKLHNPTPVGTFIPNSLKLVTSCTISYTFSKPLSALRRKSAHQPFFYFPGLNILQRIRSGLAYVLCSAGVSGARANRPHGEQPALQEQPNLPGQVFAYSRSICRRNACLVA